MRSRELVIGAVCLVFGAVGGFFLANSLNRNQPENSDPVIASAPDGNSARVLLDGPQPDVSSTLAAAESDPQNFAAQMKAGDMYAKISRFEQAVEFYKRGVLINPSNFEANVVLANALFDSQQFDEAAGYYRKALEIKPDEPDVRTDLAASLVVKTSPDYAAAISELEKVRRGNPSHAASLYYLGIANLRKGDREKASALLEDLKRLAPTSPLVGKLQENIAAAATR